MGAWVVFAPMIMGESCAFAFLCNGGLSCCGLSGSYGLVVIIIAEYTRISGEKGPEETAMKKCCLLTGSHSWERQRFS